MGKKVIEFLSFLSIFFILILVISGSMRVTYFDLRLDQYSMYLYINGALGLILYICSKINNFKFSKYEIMVFILIMFSCLSLINAIDFNTAIFGKVNRNEGLLVWLTYYIVILNAMNIKNKKYLYIIISLVLGYSLINIFYGLYQVGILKTPSLFPIVGKGIYARGFIGHWNFYGTLMCIFYGLILGFFIKTDLNLKKCLLFIGLLIANFGIIIGGAMSSFATVITISVICLIQIIVWIIKKHKNRYLYLISFIVGILSFILVFKIYTPSHSTVQNDVSKMFNEATDIVKTGDAKDTYGTGRIHIWKNAIEKIKVSPITGFGIDNFRLAFDGKLIDISSGSVVDKAHNDYLQRGVCEGIISGVYFVIFLLTIFFKGLFKKLSPLYYGLFLSFTCYSIQAFVNISVTRVAPIYFIVIGLLIGKLSENTKLHEQ